MWHWLFACFWSILSPVFDADLLRLSKCIVTKSAWIMWKTLSVRYFCGVFEVTIPVSEDKLRITSTFAHKMAFGWSLRIIFSDVRTTSPSLTHVTAIIHALSCFSADFEDNFRPVLFNLWKKSSFILLRVTVKRNLLI